MRVFIAYVNQVCVFLSTRIDNELVYQPLKCWQLK
jgi:hypothetical protein